MAVTLPAAVARASELNPYGVSRLSNRFLFKASELDSRLC